MGEDKKKLYAISAADLIKWDETHPATIVPGDFRIYVRPGDLKCDECGEQADTVHFVNAKGGAPHYGDTLAKFSCPEHDFGGYWVDFNRLLNRDEGFITHIAQKSWGLYAMAVLQRRLYEINRELQIAEGYLK